MGKIVNENIDAVILVGGRGTRLRSVIKDIPKPMALVGNHPFLCLILEELRLIGIKRVIFSTGYKHEVVEQYFHNTYKDIKLVYSTEDEPLGTGGAIKKALEKVETPNALVLNGDTFFKVALRKMLEFHSENLAEMTVALKPLENCQRYGTVNTRNSRVIGFREKIGSCSKGKINGGIYIIKKDLLKERNLPDKFSFEKDFLERFCHDIHLIPFESNAYFIDIGIPQDYGRAQQELGGVS